MPKGEGKAKKHRHYYIYTYTGRVAKGLFGFDRGIYETVCKCGKIKPKA